MLSIDANILLYSVNSASPWNAAAHAWLTSIQREENVAEFYSLLRNPAVFKQPLPADEAVEVIQAYRTHPRWRLIGFPIESRPLHHTLWQKARANDFAFRQL
jgi:predicted nucleic acid-binding protein